jgi:hypothetical protein
MIRKAILGLGMLAMASAGYAQKSTVHCGTDEFYREQKAHFPGIEAQEARLKADLDRQLKGRLQNRYAKMTADAPFNWVDDTTMMHIPVVIHIITDYSASTPVITDNDIYEMMVKLNTFYAASNTGIPGSIISPFRPYIGNARIQFHLATKDPNGKPTRGITRHYSGHAVGDDELAKIDPWAPDQYLNIWLENFIGLSAGPGTTLAYAYKPASYEDKLYGQGVISRADQVLNNPPIGGIETFAHEIGHYLNLDHPWASNAAAVEAGVCGDDEVDDTPPTKGHFSCSNAKLYDTVCAKGYMRSYDSATAYTMFKDSSLVLKDYPDTTNTQNIMDYSDCTVQMFTKGQVGRMRATLRSEVGFRSNLVTNWNLYVTGIWDSVNNVAILPTDIAPVANFSVNRPFVCADGSTSVQFVNRSYNDTATVEWTFDKGASNGNSTANAVNNAFTQEGWVNVSLKATSNAGSNTLNRNDIVYVADPNPTSPVGYFQEFNPGPENDRYPIFNYFKTDHKWELVSNAGLWDRTSIRYANYDFRSPNANNGPQSPKSDYSDFYTPAFDLSGFSPSGQCNLSFFSAGAFRTNKPSEMNDKLLVSYSADCGLTWFTIDSLKQGKIGNNGFRTEQFTPTNMNEWVEQSLPVVTRGNQVYFRFRYYPGVASPAGAISNNNPLATFGTGNNFYMDRISITSATLGVKNGVIANLGMNIVPNPTNGAASVNLNGGDGSLAEIAVTDVTGKVVYSTSVRRTSAKTQVEIPASALSVKGLYLVKVVTEGATETQKLVAY